MSEKRTDSNLYTVLFAIGMVVIVGALLAYTSSSLKGKIASNKRIEIQQNILYAMGVNRNVDESSVNFVPTNEAEAEFDKYIKKQIWIVTKNGKVQVTEAKKTDFLDIKKEQANAKDGIDRRLPLFIGEKDGETIYIAPIRGKGLWDAIWGYMAVDKNMTVKGVFFDHKGETAGLGANINQRFFMDVFEGKKLIEKNIHTGLKKFEGIKIVKAPTSKYHHVDAIAGATITGNGVSAMILSEMALYVPYFNNLK